MTGEGIMLKSYFEKHGRHQVYVCLCSRSSGSFAMILSYNDVTAQRMRP